MSIIIGIDPGSLRTGWGAVVAHGSKIQCLGYGVVDLSAAVTFAERLGRLLGELTQIIQQFQPQAFSVEKVFFGRNADSAFKLGHARGVAIAAAAAHTVPVAEYATRHVKKMLTGSGGASKEQVQFVIQHILRIRADQLDATDALALAICHAREIEVQTAFAHQRESVTGANARLAALTKKEREL